MNVALRRLAAVAALGVAGGGGVAAAPIVVVEQGSAMRHLASSADPGLGDTWTAEAFDASAWLTGVYGVGYDIGIGAQALIDTTVPHGTLSVFTRASFNVADLASVAAVAIGADYDDAWAAWVNGVEVYRSPNLPPAGPLGWNPALSREHESSNSPQPNYNPYHDITALVLPVLRAGNNLLAVAVYNDIPGSWDLVMVPQLVLNPGVPPARLGRGPYLQLATPTSLFVRWRTTAASDSVVDYGANPTSLVLSASVAAMTTEHVVPLTGLTPGATYFYRVGSSSGPLVGGDADHRFVVPPPAGTEKPSRIWAIGDSGTATATAAAVRDAYQADSGCRPTDLWLMLGDNAYDDGTDAEYQAAVFAMYPMLLRSSVLWPTLGNHDAGSASSATETGPYYDIFTLPRAAEAGGVASGTEAYYSFDFANVHFVCLDSQDSDRSVGGAMYTWLEADLSANTRDWLVVFFHHPFYTKGSHDSDTEIEHIEMREHFGPLLESHGVDLMLAGHSHSYERSYLIDGHYGPSPTFGPANQVDAGDGRLGGDGAYQKPAGGPAAHAGTVYVVDGSSGHSSGGPLDHPAMLVSLDVLGSLVLDVSGGRIDATFLDDRGAVRDDFALFKGAAVPPVAPAGLTAVAGPGATIDLSWRDRDALETTFVLEQSAGGAAWVEIGRLPAGTTSFHDSGLTVGITYGYRVHGENAAGASLPDDCDAATAVTVCTGPLPPAPSVPPACVLRPVVLDCVTFEPEVTYDWDFEDDGTFDATECVVAHVYPAVGTYTARVRARDGLGCTVSVTVPVVVGPDLTPAEAGPLKMIKVPPAGVRGVWPTLDDAATFRVARGDLGTFPSHVVDDALGIGRCNLAGTIFDDPDDLPGPTSYYYLVAGRGACGRVGAWGAPPPPATNPCP